jgi:acyl-CoA thioesterase-1
MTRLRRRSVVLLLLTLGFATDAAPQSSGAGETDRPVILAIGESTTAGFGVPVDRSYPAQLQARLDADGYAYRVVNFGRSGITSSMALSSLTRGMALVPKIVLIALGGNDRGNRVAAAATRENMGRMIRLYKMVGATVFLADRGATGEDGSTLFSELAETEGAILMPSLRHSVAGHPELLLSDGSHPNAAGYAIVTEQILGQIEPYLERP